MTTTLTVMMTKIIDKKENVNFVNKINPPDEPDIISYQDQHSQDPNQDYKKLHHTSMTVI